MGLTQPSHQPGGPGQDSACFRTLLGIWVQGLWIPDTADVKPRYRLQPSHYIFFGGGMGWGGVGGNG